MYTSAHTDCVPHTPRPAPGARGHLSAAVPVRGFVAYIFLSSTTVNVIECVQEIFRWTTIFTAGTFTNDFAHIWSSSFHCIAQAKKFLHTRYHVIPKMEIAQPFGIKW